MPKKRRKVSVSKEQAKLQKQIVACRKCPRLIEHCEKIAVEKRRAYLDQDYWGKPVPNFGSSPASLLVVGLAPGAHGANRTGRMFTGDRSGDWLYRTMHKYGFASQAPQSDLDDGLELINAMVTNVCHCAPPGNKPVREEISNCQPFLEKTFLACDPRGGDVFGKTGVGRIVSDGAATRMDPKQREAPKVRSRCHLFDGIKCPLYWQLPSQPTKYLYRTTHRAHVQRGVSQSQEVVRVIFFEI